jgi:hypothetical protein
VSSYGLGTVVIMGEILGTCDDDQQSVSSYGLGTVVIMGEILGTCDDDQ